MWDNNQFLWLHLKVRLSFILQLVKNSCPVYILYSIYLDTNVIISFKYISFWGQDSSLKLHRLIIFALYWWNFSLLAW